MSETQHGMVQSVLKSIFHLRKKNHEGDGWVQLGREALVSTFPSCLLCSTSGGPRLPTFPDLILSF